MRIIERVRALLHEFEMPQASRIQYVAGISLLTLFALPTLSASATVVAEFNGPYTEGYSVSYTSTYLGQSFLAQQGGKVSTIEFPVHDLGGAFNVKFSLLSTSGGAPGAELASVTLPSTAVPDAGQSFFAVDFSTFQVTLTGGVQYLVSVQVVGGALNDQVRWATGVGNNPYPSGRLYLNQDGTWNTSAFLAESDVGFRVSVIPEPASVMTLALAGMLALGFTRRRGLDIRLRFNGAPLR